MTEGRGRQAPAVFLMHTIHLSSRLLAVAELVPPGGHVIDVGTDHGMLPVWLVQTGRAEHVWASDLRSGPLQSAERLIAETGTGERIDLRLTDGLQGFSADDADTVVIAGMGGETMVSILAAAPWLHEGVSLILQPQSKQGVLRRWLAENGFTVTCERLVRDAGRIYPILTAEDGISPPYTEAEYHIGRWTKICHDPLLPEFLTAVIRRVSAAAAYDASQGCLLDELQDMKVRLNHADSQ